MASIFDSLIFDRTPQDVQEVFALGAKIANGTATAEEETKWNNGMKGALSPQDITRIRNCLLAFKSWLQNNGITYNVTTIDPQATIGKIMVIPDIGYDVKALSALLKYPFADDSAFPVPPRSVKSTDIDSTVYSFVMYNRIENALRDCRPNVSWQSEGSDQWHTLYWTEEDSNVSWVQLLNRNGYTTDDIKVLVFNTFIAGTEYPNVSWGSFTKLKTMYLNIPKITNVKSTYIETVYLSENVTTILESAFSAGTLSKLTTINLPSSLKTIGKRAFMNCQKIGSPVFPSGLTTLGDEAYRNCDNIEEAILPNSVTSLGKGCFAGCAKLQKVVLGSGITVIDGTAISSNGNLFFLDQALTDLTISNSLQEIIGSPFFGCNHLTDITFNGTMAEWNAVTKDEDWAMGSISGTIYIQRIVCNDGTINL